MRIVFVQLADVLVDGLVHVSELTDDYYVFEEHRQRLVGERSGRSLRLGDPVEVLLVRVNLETMQLELAMAPGKGANGRRRRGARNGKPRTVRRGTGPRGAARE